MSLLTATRADLRVAQVIHVTEMTHSDSFF